MSDEPFLARWSRKKTQARKGDVVAGDEGLPAPTEAPSDSVAPAVKAADAPAPLPPVESLTPESDFSPFMRPKVDESLKRQALKTLFQDPRFNVMDGLDVYIDDFSKPDPIPEGWLEKMTQVARLGAYRDPEEKEAPGNAQGDEDIQSAPASSADSASNPAVEATGQDPDASRDSSTADTSLPPPAVTDSEGGSAR